MAIRRGLALALLSLLAACQGEKAAQPGKQAGGQILEGSASDAMLPLDRLRSQPPLAPKSELGANAKGGAAPKAKSSAKAETAAPEPEPAAEPEAPAAEAEGE